MTRFLSQYPRPQADTGWGFHDSAGTQARPSDAAAFGRYLRQDLGVTWFKALVAGNNKVDLVDALSRQGIEVIVRLYSHQPHPFFVVSPAEVRAYVQAGAHYLEWGNEPNLIGEWNLGSWNEGARVDKVCEQYLRNADAIRQGGGVPLLPALSPGGDYPHRDWYRTAFEWLRLHSHLGDLDGAALAIHNRPFNNPLASSDATGCCFLEYEWIDDLVRQYVGRSLPLLGTEGGYEPGWHQNAAFPPIDPQRHAAYNVEILRCFGPHGSRRWRDALFCQCMWLADHFGHKDFAEASWHNNQQWASGGNLPAVGALRAEWQAHPFQRTWAWETGKPDYPKATWRGSPNTDARPAGVAPALVVIYPTNGDFNAALQRLQDPGSQASFHYIVSRSGAIYQLVSEANRAWHAGDAAWKGRPRVNDFSLAVGLVNRNDGTDTYPNAQLDQAAALVHYMLDKYRIAPAEVVTGDMVRGSGTMPGFDLVGFMARVQQGEIVWPPEEVIRQAAWHAGGIPYNADAAFPRYARHLPEYADIDHVDFGRLNDTAG